MSVNIKLVIFISFVAIILLVVYFLPADPSNISSTTPSSADSSKNSSSSSYDVVRNSPWDGSVPQVKSYIKRSLKDPGSFEAIAWGTVAKTSDGNFQVTCKYRAKNSFGGYAVSHQMFTLNSQGMVINVQE